IVGVIHLCHGTDLDAWAIYNWLFSVTWGNWPYYYFPIVNQNLMCAGSTKVHQGPPGSVGYSSYYRAGNFTIWDNVTGQLWPREIDSATSSFPDPPYGGTLVGGGSALWQFNC